jgi:hypothetical protein
MVGACGAATGIPVDFDARAGDAGTQDGTRPSHDGTTPPPSGDGSHPTADGSDATDDAGEDSTVRDDARPRADASLRDASPDTSPPLNPDERVAGSGFAIVGVTDHGLIIYGDTNGTCWALPFAGGPARTFSSSLGATSPGPCAGGLHSNATISHDVVFMSVNEALYTWTSAMSTPALLPAATDGGVAPAEGVASADSRYVAYQAASAGTGFPQFTLADVDGSNALFLGVGSVELDESFAVYGGATYGGDVSPTPLVALDGTHAWSRAMLSPTSTPFAVDAIGDVLFTSVAGLTFAPLDGSAPVSIAASGADGSSLYLAPDGTFAMYEVGTNTLKGVALPSGTPYDVQITAGITLGSLETVRSDAPGGPVAVFQTEALDPPASTLTIVDVGPNASAPYAQLTNYRVAIGYENGDGFTADGAYVLVIGSTPESDVEFGSVALAAFSAPSLLTTTGYDGRALLGSRVIFLDDYVRVGELQYQGTADVRVADVATGTTSTLVVSNVDAYFGLSPDRTAMAYTINRGTAADGLYVMALPDGS